jgi:membrane peptidoglycan carboxypeptidase
VLAFLALSTVVGVIGSALALPLVGALDQARQADQAFVDSLPVSLLGSVAPQRSVMLAADGSPIAYFYDEDRADVMLAQVARPAQQAVVAVEDARFFQHGAVDPRGLVRAAVADASGRSVQGASTLTQQYVKNLLLEAATATGGPGAGDAAVARSVGRKVREARLAMLVETRLTKQEILQRYLNIVFFGDQVYGVQAAAQRYFGVDAAGLTVPQAALLAGMLKDPAAYSPVTHPRAAVRRRNLVLADMRDQAMITAAQYRAAIAAPLGVRGQALPNGCATAGSSAYFCQYVVESLLAAPQFSAMGVSVQDREQVLHRGGLVIKTSLDPVAQGAAVGAVDRGMPSTDPSGLAAAAVTVEPGTGKVVAMAEDRGYGTVARPGQTSVNYSVDSGLGGAQGFQIGSAFKPFTLATWLAHGHRLDETVDATRRAFALSGFTACGKHLAGPGSYAPGNSEGSESGPISVLQATADSVNVAYVDMESRLDLCDIASTAQALGLHLGAPQQECGAPVAGTGVPTCLPSLTLGVTAIAPLTVAAAYAGFAAGGRYCAPMPVTQIVQTASDDEGSSEVVRGVPDCRQALAPEVASGVTTALTHVLTDGTASAVGPLDPWPSAGKTGTTDGPYDSWFVGYTGQRSTAVWVADPGRPVNGTFRRRQLIDVTADGTWYPVVYGATIAAPIWKDVMDGVMHGLPARPLP